MKPEYKIAHAALTKLLNERDRYGSVSSELRAALAALSAILPFLPDTPEYGRFMHEVLDCLQDLDVHSHPLARENEIRGP